MTAYCLNVDGMKSFVVNVTIFVLTRRQNSYVGPVHAANDTRETTSTIEDILTGSKFGIRRGPLYKTISPRNQHLRNLCYYSRNGRFIYANGVSHDLKKTATGIKSQSEEDLREWLQSVITSSVAAKVTGKKICYKQNGLSPKPVADT